MSQVGPSAITARRRPGLILALAAIRIFCGFLLAWPLTSAIAAGGLGSQPDGDRALFEPGGYLLLELLRVQGPAFFAALHGLLPLALLGLLLVALSNATLLVGLNHDERLRDLSWLARVWRRVPGLLVVSLGASLAQAVVLGVGFMGLGSIPESLTHPATATLAQVGLGAVTLLLASAVGGAADVAKAALVRHEAPLGQGLASAWRCLLARPLRGIFGWFPAAALYVTTAGVVAWLSGLCDVSRPGAWRVATVFLLHQAVIVVGVAARASWFARTLRLVATASTT